jgi:hypothetical protein
MLSSCVRKDPANKVEGERTPNAWFAKSSERPLVFFAAIWVPQWESVRKIKEGLTTADLFANDDPERDHRADPSEGDAGLADRGRRNRDLAYRPVGRGKGSAACLARRPDGAAAVTRMTCLTSAPAHRRRRPCTSNTTAIVLAAFSGEPSANAVRSTTLPPLWIEDKLLWLVLLQRSLVRGK